MVSIGHVDGGTNAGWRRIKPDPDPWFCCCWELESPGGQAPDVAVKKKQWGWRTRCDDCGERRPR